MKIKVINLDRREDRRQQFIDSNAQYLPEVEFFEAYDGRSFKYQDLVKAGWDTNKDWRDPALDRVLTRGEIGCFISHYRLWEQCAEEGVPYLILEDDVVFDRALEFPASDGDFDILYLCYSEQIPRAVQELDKNYVIPAYPYWLAAYVIGPSAAKKLISTDIRSNIIPCDEYVPQMIAKGDLKAVALKEQICRQRLREDAGTNIEPTSEADYIRDFETHVLTVGSDNTKMSKLLDSAFKQKISVENICGPSWKGTDMSGPGGGQKLVDLKYWLVANEIPDHDVVLFTDAYDVFYGANLDTILGRFLGFKHEIVFSAEQYLWPDDSLRFPPTHTKYKYLNSGTFIGRVGEIKRLLANSIKPDDDDQHYLQKQYLSGHFDIALDVEQYIFTTHEEKVEINNGMIYNPLTECFSCVYHGNGGKEAKNKFEQLYEALYPKSDYLEVRDYKVIANEMLLIKCFTEEDCQHYIDVSEKHGGWNPHPDDNFPSHDIHLKALGLWDKMENYWKNQIAPICEKYWQPYLHYHLRKAFTMKYSPDTQKTLGLHTDASLVTGSMKLNNDYEGATLIFPRQNVSNKDIPIGSMILFPGQVTHGHYVDELKSGTKYSLTLWTARYQGDILD